MALLILAASQAYDFDAATKKGDIFLSQATFDMSKLNPQTDYIAIRSNKHFYVFKVIGNYTVINCNNNLHVPDENFWHDSDMLQKALENGNFYVARCLDSILSDVHPRTTAHLSPDEDALVKKVTRVSSVTIISGNIQ